MNRLIWRTNTKHNIELKNKQFYRLKLKIGCGNGKRNMKEDETYVDEDLNEMELEMKTPLGGESSKMSVWLPPLVALQKHTR